jgi:hypothetical protein
MAAGPEPSRLRRTYIASAMGKRENRLAAVVTVGVAVAVGLYSQAPLAAGRVADLTQPRVRWASVSAAYLGFGPPSEAGRPIRAGVARVVWNRPLPSRFVVEVAARSLGSESRPLEVAVGDVRKGERVSPQGSRLRLPVSGAAGWREIRFTGSDIAVSRVGIEPSP